MMTTTDGKDILNSTEFKNLRRSLANGEKNPICDNCWKLEEGGGFSYRQESLRDNDIHAEWRSALEDLGEFYQSYGDRLPPTIARSHSETLRRI